MTATVSEMKGRQHKAIQAVAATLRTEAMIIVPKDNPDNVQVHFMTSTARNDREDFIKNLKALGVHDPETGNNTDAKSFYVVISREDRQRLSGFIAQHGLGSIGILNEGQPVYSKDIPKILGGAFKERKRNVSAEMGY